MKALLPLAFVGISAAFGVQAATVDGGSDLLTGANASVVESWLTGGPGAPYSGSLIFSNIFDKAAGDTSRDFHSAVDGKGATITVMEVVDNSVSDVSFLIGGFSPQSWSSVSGYNMSASVAERTGFLFNLTTGQRLFQETGNAVGAYETRNGPNYGPTFGAGHDLYVDASLTQGYARTHGYCYDASVNCYHGSLDPAVNKNILGNTFGGLDSLSFGAIEVFTISEAPLLAAASVAGPIAPVPVPAGLPLLVAALAGLGFLRSRKS